MTAAAEAEATADQVADRAVALLRQGAALLAEADALLIRASLAETAEDARERIAELEREIQATEPELAAATAELERLQAERAECQRRAISIRDANNDANLSIRIEARALAAAVTEELASLADRIQAAGDVVSVHDAAIGRAASRVNELEAELAELAAATAAPFTHPRAQQTAAYAMRVLSGRTLPLLLGGDSGHPEYQPAYGYLVHLARVTGLGAAVESRVEAGVADKHSPVHFTPDGTPFMYRNPTAEQVQAALRQVTTLPSGAEVSADAAFATGFERVPGTATGFVPGVSGQDASLV